MSIAIKAEGLSKAYQLGEIGTGTISRDLERWVARMRGKEDPFLKIGEANDRAAKGTSDVVWSLRDISFEIEQGDAVGIIGRNGAGKSTLLKILSRVTSPSAGSIHGNGRVASLLEVGTGFHPELTGRENIFLNGAIMGMRKKEIARKFDEIVDFAGVERYIDTPVKRYSSGMYVRLAFAVAAHLESEILIVDEVLAVGDAEFQKKCLGKMGEVSKGEGRTVLFVSHNMGSVASLCNTGMLLDKGRLEFTGPVDQTLNNYILKGASVSRYVAPEAIQRKLLYIKEFFLSDKEGEERQDYYLDENLYLRLKIYAEDYSSSALISVTLQNSLGDFLSTFVLKLTDHEKTNNEVSLNIMLPSHLIAPNSYAFRIAIFTSKGIVYDLVESVCPIKIFDSGSDMAAFEGINYGHFMMGYEVL